MLMLLSLLLLMMLVFWFCLHGKQR